MAGKKQTRKRKTTARSGSAGATRRLAVKTVRKSVKSAARKKTRKTTRRTARTTSTGRLSRGGAKAGNRKPPLLHREVFTIGGRDGKMTGERANPVRQRAMLASCAASLRKVTDACRPRSAVGTLGIFLFGVLIGLIVLGGFMYVSKNEVLLRLLIDEDVSVLDGVPVKITEEIDYSFSTDPSFLNTPADLRDVDLTEFWEVWRLIEQDFVPKPERRVADDDGDEVVEEIAGVGPTREEMVRGAIDGLTFATDDQYTNFFEPRDAKEFEEEVLNGEIDGIGAYISFEDGSLTIVNVIDNGPAFYAGLKGGDVISAIDGVASDEYNLTEAAYAIRGPQGTGVLLSIYRASEERDFDITIVRGRVEIPTVEYEVVDGVFVIRLMTFTKNTPNAFREALREFVVVANAGGPNRILLDMRGNVGGVMAVAVDIAGLFLPDGSVVLYEYRGDENLRSFGTTGPVFKNNVLPIMTVLVDGGSASSSEIVAAALRHYGVADIVGVPTLGKGSVQSLKEVGESSSLLKITIAHWLTPAKESVEEVGIQPDVDYSEDIDGLLEENSYIDVEEYVLDRAVKHLKRR